MSRLLCLTTALFSLSLTPFLIGQTSSTLPPAAQIKVDFVKDVLPILTQKCHSCHGEDVRQSGLRLDRRQAALRGGDYGPVIIPGDSARSKLIRRVANGDGGLIMPPTGRMSDQEIGILRAWIDQGADFRMEVVDEPAPKPLDPKVAALISAVRSHDTKSVEKLLKSDPELRKAQDNQRSTLLHHAAGFGSLETMRLLLDHGADVNAKNRRRSAPIFWAIHDEAKVRLLIERGADIKLKQADGRTPVYQASVLGNSQAVLGLLLEKGADPNVQTAAGITPLIAASGRGDVEAMQLLIAKGADIHGTNAAGATPLMAAAGSGNPRAVELLLKRGADAKAKDKKNGTALAEAATQGVEESVRLLLDAGADVNVADDRGYTPLMYAAGTDAAKASILKMLLAKGADPKATAEGETAASLAARRGDTDVARLLSASVPKVAATVDSGGDIDTGSIPGAVQKSLALLEKQSHNFIRIGGCNSCHAQDLPSAAAAIARDRGLQAPKTIPQLPMSMMGTSPERIMDLNAFGVGSVAWEMFDYGMNGIPKDEYTDAVVHYTKAMQTPGGYWKTTESRRPPMATGVYQTAALAVFTLKQYSRDAEKAESDAAMARAAAWLERSRPSLSQDRAFHLMGLVWANGSSHATKRAASALAAMQRSDGGWSQLPALGSDAYATGQALYALNLSGMTVSDPVYQKGIRYLLRTQAADGSWHVNSRSIWIQPYFESGFPYSHDQWISAAGTAWASMALSVTLEPRRISQNTAAR